MAAPQTVAGGFRTLITCSTCPPCSSGRLRLLRFMTWHHMLKSYYFPLLVRPLFFLSGGLCLFGDHTLFFRASDFWSVGGYDESLPIMEDVDLLIRLNKAGPSANPADLLNPDHAQVLKAAASTQPHSGIATSSYSSHDICTNHCSNLHTGKASAAHSQPRSKQSMTGSPNQPRLSERARGGIWATLWCRTYLAVQRFRRRGKVRLIFWPPAVTSGRRLEALGNLRATRIHLTIGLAWYWGVSRQTLVDLYNKLYDHSYR